MNFYELLLNRGQPSGEGMTHFERLFAAKLAGGGEIKELEGVPPLLFKANGEPLIDWSIYGNTVQSATPTPQNPVMPQGTGERTINLFNKNDVENKIVSREGVENRSNYYILSTFISVDNGVTVSATKLLTDPMRIIRYDANKQFISRTDENTADNIVVDDCSYIRINANKDHWDLNTIQVEYGRTATSYEPYGVKIPISSAGSTTPVYLGEVETTRKIYKYEITGNETFTPSSNPLYYIVTLQKIPLLRSGLLSTHFIAGGNDIAEGTCRFAGSEAVPDSRLIFNYDNGAGGIANFKSWIAQQYTTRTPVTVWYVLATEETAVVNEPLMKIGEYADTLTATQSGVEIPTIKGNNTLDIDTTIKPTNVYIKYKT